ncbi:MAG: hypothetical protein JNK47_16770 [Mesorhizobium sp.]|nr:hypothetical protein [Mesorhizobium sp.]MBL8578878.1 hypothetical protein [Mesorhizobium sp.]
MSNTQPELKVGESREYWMHKVDAFPSPVAQFRMAQLIDFDDRLYETARVVYRFLVGWYHDDHGDALLSQREVARVMKQRAPDGSIVPSRNAVQRAIIALMDTGWVVRTAKGRGRSAKSRSRYIPVVNVLDLAAQGKFPELAHAIGPVEGTLNRPTPMGQLVAHANGPLDGEPAHVAGHQTRLQDPVTKTRVPVVIDNSAPVDGRPLAAAPGDGFDRLCSAYAKSDDNRAKARAAFKDINPDDTELERMVTAAASWKRTATGKRMSLERWLHERRWETAEEFANDNRKTHRFPSCVITRIKPRWNDDDFEGAQIWFRDRDGTAHTRVLDASEYGWLKECCYENARLMDPSEDLHEFVGARFQIDAEGFVADLTEWQDAA